VGSCSLGQALSPKAERGPRPKGSESLNAVLGAKTWWRWITEGNTPWAHLWHKKYFPHIERQGLIRLTRDIPGSHIWNAAWANKHLVHSHCFWEIRNGRSPSSGRIPGNNFHPSLRMITSKLRDLMTTQDRIWTHQYWLPPKPGDIWRMWIPKEEWIPHQPIPNWDPLWQEISHIGKSEFNKANTNSGGDINQTGSFSLQEAHKLATMSDNQPTSRHLDQNLVAKTLAQSLYISLAPKKMKTPHLGKPP
jgi:hypothetical protein